MKKWIVLSMIAALAGASQAASLKEGTKEITVSGLFDPDTIADQQLELAVAYGVFIQDNVEVGVRGEASDNDVVGTYAIGAFAEYNFDQGTELVPFVGAGLDWQSYDVDDGESADAVVGSLTAGVKYFLAENVAVSADVTGKLASDDVFDEQDDISDQDIAINLGMRFYIP